VVVSQGMPISLEVYEVALIDEKEDDSVVVGGIRLTSRALSRNLAQVERLFPYVATCGTEVDSIATPDDGIRRKAWLYVPKGELVGKWDFGQQVKMRCWNSIDARKATPAWLPFEVLNRPEEEIIAAVPGVVSVIYNIVTKPMSTVDAV
jgi:GMP synthase PP-ATPase subunit